MSLILKKLNKHIKKTNLPNPVNSARVKLTDYNVDIELDGIFSTIMIEYSGSCIIYPNMQAGIVHKSNSKKYLITNLFGQKISKNLFSYNGKFKIERFEVYSFNATMIDADVEDLSTVDNAEEYSIPVESDDTLLFEDDYLKDKRLKKHGVSKIDYSQFLLNKNVKSKFGRGEIDKIKTLITKRSLIENVALKNNDYLLVKNIKDKESTDINITKPDINQPETFINQDIREDFKPKPQKRQRGYKKEI